MTIRSAENSSALIRFYSSHDNIAIPIVAFGCDVVTNNNIYYVIRMTSLYEPIVPFSFINCIDRWLRYSYHIHIQFPVPFLGPFLHSYCVDRVRDWDM